MAREAQGRTREVRIAADRARPHVLIRCGGSRLGGQTGPTPLVAVPDRLRPLICLRLFADLAIPASQRSVSP